MRALIAVLAIVAMPSPEASACKCVEPSLGTAASRAKLAFVGTISEVIETKHCNPKQPQWCASSFAYVVTVEGVWKGDLDEPTVTMEGGGGTGDCSRGQLGKVTGQRWLFLSSGSHSIRLCSGTRRATASVITAMTKRFGAPAS